MGVLLRIEQAPDFAREFWIFRVQDDFVEGARARNGNVEIGQDPFYYFSVVIGLYADAEAHFRAATSGVEGRRWPFDYARAKLDQWVAATQR